MSESPHEITALLDAHARGDERAMDRLFEAIYGELRRVARGQKRRSPTPPTIDTAEIVSELYLKLLEGDAGIGRNRGHFLAIAATAIRHLLVDRAKAARRAKRGGGVAHVTLSGVDAARSVEIDRILGVDLALARLERLEPRLARVVELRHFLGLSEEETAAVLGISLRTVQRDWRSASKWLARELRATGKGDS